MITNKCDYYDIINEGYSGPLYVEVTPITFPIIVKEGVSLNQIRLFRGYPELSKIKEEEIELFGNMVIAPGGSGGKESRGNLSLDLSPTDIKEEKVIAFTTKGRKFRMNPIDLCNAERGRKIDPSEYWKLVSPNAEKYIEIKREQFYILKSKERFRLPEDVGIYCQAITENLGEIRIHYAGFVHPGFGMNRKEGTPLIFEVRGHTVDAFLRDGELMARIYYYRTSEKADISNAGDYDMQELKLSKYFDMEKWKI